MRLIDLAFTSPPAAINITHMTLLSRLISFIALLLALSHPAAAEQQDVAATVRGVVRVVIIATDGDKAYFVGHGSGFAVAPDKVMTNAHVVELLRTERNLVVGIIPSEGSRSYGGRVVAYSPGNDLALIELREGTLPVATFFAGAVSDGQNVTAIGYPGAVDRAQGLNLDEMIRPLSPVKTSGTVSTGRASHGFDTVLHTAPMAQGNSGGPLIDECGRVLGINSFGSQAESKADAEFGFAVSNREIFSFLRQANIQFRLSSTQCRSIADLDAEEAQRQREEMTRQQQAEEARQAALAKKHAIARDHAEQEIYAQRENAMALAAVLLVIGGLAMGSALMFHSQRKTRERGIAIGTGTILLIAAAIVFFMRPSFSKIDDYMVLPDDMNGPGNPEKSLPGDAPYAAAGDNICSIDEARSRITVSDAVDVPLHWQDSGCVNNTTQYGRNDTGWSRIFVPNTQAVVSMNSFNPATGIYRVERYLADAATMQQARELRGQFTFNGCTADAETLAALQNMQQQIQAVLSASPNERLIYQCRNSAPPEE